MERSRAGEGGLFGADGLAQAEVADLEQVAAQVGQVCAIAVLHALLLLRLVYFLHQYVMRLDVPVNDSFPVQIADRVRKLRAEHTRQPKPTSNTFAQIHKYR